MIPGGALRLGGTQLCGASWCQNLAFKCSDQKKTPSMACHGSWSWGLRTNIPQHLHSNLVRVSGSCRLGVVLRTGSDREGSKASISWGYPLDCNGPKVRFQVPLARRRLVNRVRLRLLSFRNCWCRRRSAAAEEWGVWIDRPGRRERDGGERDVVVERFLVKNKGPRNSNGVTENNWVEEELV
ncbi:uncharacterized protein BCR38DRAFT_135517 [Pseudomassariella vexata]|uniref:Uncharacterized protein n=1 Tax=Pseudomassariella vexata TaxID=1141098 RepID=A0A1Y2EAL3_9PEZI|nr:uncharacterized protein BCR38DRAFT_135517 [Pseudomassariella vexata]ORY68628.1 hypothetical protein BCR38DRAFT_135517 [Pseudomassariella vexata]